MSRSFCPSLVISHLIHYMFTEDINFSLLQFRASNLRHCGFLIVIVYDIYLVLVLLGSSAVQCDDGCLPV